MCRSSSPGRGNFFLRRADPSASAEKGVVGAFPPRNARPVATLNEPVLMHPISTNAPKFATFVTAAVEDQAANAHCSQIFDKRQTASTRSAPSVIRGSPPAQTAELSATPPSHPPGEWPTSANERYLLQKLSLFRVAAFFSGCWEWLCSQVPF